MQLNSLIAGSLLDVNIWTVCLLICRVEKSMYVQAGGLRRQIASGSLIHWSLEGPNWIMDSEVNVCARVRVCVSVWWDREGHVGWPFSVAPLPWPISFNQAARQALPFLPRPLLSATPTHVLHYGALPGQCLEISPEEATGRERDKDKEGPDFTKEKNPDPIFIKILPLSCFLEVITGLPKLDWGK